MKSITKQEAHEFKERWKLVKNFIAHQIRNTPPETKLQQLSVMFVIGRRRSTAFLSEEQEVRNRWRLLKQKANVSVSIATQSPASATGSTTWV